MRRNGNQTRDKENDRGKYENPLAHSVKELAEQHRDGNQTDNNSRAAYDYGRGYLECVEVKLEIVLDIDEYVG